MKDIDEIRVAENLIAQGEETLRLLNLQPNNVSQGYVRAAAIGALAQAQALVAIASQLQTFNNRLDDVTYIGDDRYGSAIRTKPW